MTTIAYRNGTIAADTQAEAGGWLVPGGVAKIRRVSPSIIVGVTGDWCALEPWLVWFDGGCQGVHDLGEASRIILADADAEGLTIYEGKGWFTFTAPFGAWGSGWPAAVAAMHMGADAKRAVEIAALLDPSTGSEVMTMSVRA